MSGTVIHHASPAFWSCYEKLPIAIQRLADRGFQTLKRDEHHPSLHLKKIGRYWSVRVGAHYRALAVESPQGIVWFWIGTHADYDTLLR